MSSLPLESRANSTAWDWLLQKALPTLDHVFAAEVSIGALPFWTLGGGTALALRIAHRLSDDVNTFVPSRPLKDLTPAANPGAKAISSKYQWPGHYLKYQCDEGEIDFLSPHLQTKSGFTIERYRSRPIALETAAEVIVKKYDIAQVRSQRAIFSISRPSRVSIRRWTSSWLQKSVMHCHG